MNAAAQVLTERLQQTRRFSTTYNFKMIFLIVIVLMSSLALIYFKETYRSMQVTLQELQREKEALWLEGQQLVLEHSTWAAPTRVQRIATQQIQMYSPQNITLVTIE